MSTRPSGQPPAKVAPQSPSASPVPTVAGAFAFQQVTLSSTGPLPAPEVLAGYKEVQPDLVERVVRQMEAEAEHRRSIEVRVVQAAIDRAARGQIFGLLIGLMGLGAATFCAWRGLPTTASIIAALDIVTLVGVFVTGKRDTVKKGEPKIESAQLQLPNVR